MTPVNKKHFQNLMNKTMLEKQIVDRAFVWQAMRTTGSDLEREVAELDLLEAIQTLRNFKSKIESEP